MCILLRFYLTYHNDIIFKIVDCTTLAVRTNTGFYFLQNLKVVKSNSWITSNYLCNNCHGFQKCCLRGLPVRIRIPYLPSLKRVPEVNTDDKLSPHRHTTELANRAGTVINWVNVGRGIINYNAAVVDLFAATAVCVCARLLFPCLPCSSASTRPIVQSSGYCFWIVVLKHWSIMLLWSADITQHSSVGAATRETTRRARRRASVYYTFTYQFVEMNVTAIIS